MQTKELRFRDVITEHDLATKVRSAIGFFKRGYHVVLQLGFKRSVDFDPESAIAIMQNICDRLTFTAIIDGDIKFSSHRYATQRMIPKRPGKSAKNARETVGASPETVDKIRKEAAAFRAGKSIDEIEEVVPEFMDLEREPEGEYEEGEEAPEEAAPAASGPDEKLTKSQRIARASGKASAAPPPPTPAPPNPAPETPAAPAAPYKSVQDKLQEQFMQRQASRRAGRQIDFGAPEEQTGRGGRGGRGRGGRGGRGGTRGRGGSSRGRGK